MSFRIDETARDYPFEQRIRERFEEVFRFYRAVVVGRDGTFWSLVLCLLSGQNAILEGNPGGGKSLLLQVLASLLELKVTKIQGKADTMPRELVGYRVWDEQVRQYDLHRGPALTGNILFFDEINRASTKALSALLTVIQDGHAAIEGIEELPEVLEPFHVFGTMNPQESERAVYELGAAFLDRFALLHLMADLTSEEMAKAAGLQPKLLIPRLKPVIKRDELLAMARYCKKLALKEAGDVDLGNDEKLMATASRRCIHPALDYIARVAKRTEELAKESEYERANGVSTRGVHLLWQLLHASRIVSGGRAITPKSVKALVYECYGHRMNVGHQAAYGILDGALRSVPYVPRA